MEESERRKYLGTIHRLKELLAVQAIGGQSSVADHQYYREARTELVTSPQIGGLLPGFLLECHTLRDFWGFIHSSAGVVHSPLIAHPEKLEILRKAFLPVLDALENNRLPQFVRNAQQFLPPKSQHDGFVAARDILAGAKTSVMIADNWVDSTIFPLLTNLQPGTEVRILTDERHLPKDFVAECEKFTRQYRIKVAIKYTKELHDRFVVIDGSSCTHLGASLKDLGMKAALMSEVTSEALLKAVTSALNTLWASGISAT